MPKAQDPQSPKTFARRQSLAPFAVAGALLLAGLAAYGIDLASEPHFMDESAYLSQASYYDFYISGKVDREEWLWYAAYDLPPLTKYLVGFALKAAGYPRPPVSDSWRWYANPGTRIGSPAMLTAARRPSVFLGAVGVVAIFAIGAVAADRRVGTLAALLLLINPLYRMHARRAMSDIPAEACLLVALALGLWGWKRLARGLDWGAMAAIGLGSGVFLGLSVLSKLNGSLAGMVLAAWFVLAMVVPGYSSRGRIGLGAATLAAGLGSIGVFVAGNPFVTAHPPAPYDARLEDMARLGLLGRLKAVSDHRVEVSAGAMTQFPHNALPTLMEKVPAVAVQAFGRFGPLGPPRTNSEIRFDRAQDWGAWIFGPLVLVGFAAAIVWGRRQVREACPPTTWAVAVQAVLSLAVVTAFIPLAWDRYYLSIQAGSALLAATALVFGWDLLRSRFAKR